jgi:hypothetical protein
LTDDLIRNTGRSDFAITDALCAFNEIGWYPMSPPYRPTRRRPMKITIPTIVVVSAALILAPAPAAHADPNDDVFLHNLANAGIHEFPYPLVQEGHSICHTLDLGPSGGGYVPDMADRMAQTFRQWLTRQQVADLIVDSVLAYCPYDRDKLNF